MRSVMGPLAAVVVLVACSGDDGGGGAAGGASGAGGGSGQGSAGATSGSGGSGGAGSGSSGAGGGSGGAADAGPGDAGGYTRVGVCGQRGMGSVDASSFTGYEEFYLIDDEGFGEEVCVVRFEATRVGAAPDGCDDPAADVTCLWTHLVEFGNPSVVTDVDGVCADSELGLDSDAIAAITGTRAAYGFVSEFAGHASVVLKFDDSRGDWDAYGMGTWDDETSAFRFDHRDGFCNY